MSYQSVDPIHPGETLQDELQAREITPAQLAEMIGESESIVQGIVSSEVAITDQLAEKLEQALEIPAYFWLKSQKRFDEHPKNTHGGKRPGAGRPSSGLVTKQIRITATEEEIQAITAWLKSQPSGAQKAAEVLYSLIAKQ